MDIARLSQVVAILFKEAGVVEVAVESFPGFHSFPTKNSEAGLRVFERELAAIRLREQPFICMCMTPGADLGGVFFEEMHSAPFPKFLFSQAAFLEYARTHETSAQGAESLLRAFRQQFPRRGDAA